MRHIREVHRYFDGPVRCGIDGCPSTATTYESLRQHIYKKHKEALQQSEDHRGQLIDQADTRSLINETSAAQ